jgi:hypothetical protein
MRSLTLHWEHHPQGRVDQIEDLTEEVWRDLRTATLQGDQVGFTVKLVAEVLGPPGGWSTEWTEACWRAAGVCWGP